MVTLGIKFMYLVLFSCKICGKVCYFLEILCTGTCDNFAKFSDLKKKFLFKRSTKLFLFMVKKEKHLFRVSNPIALLV